MLGGVHVGRLSGHEVEEAVELDEAAAVRVDDGHDALEVDLSLERKKGLNVQKESWNGLRLGLKLGLRYMTGECKRQGSARANGK